MAVQLMDIKSVFVDRFIVETKIDGKLTNKDYETLVPVIELLMSKRTVNLIVVLRNFHGWTEGVQWHDTKFAAKNFDKIDRIAIVGDKLLERWIADFCKPFISGTVRYFDSTDFDHAKRWVSHNLEAQPTSHSSHIH